ncbi:MAG: hypothetical protein M3R27_01085 [Bacteroidota bacterium]|nr:hypothetical protein [Bacteroidota bacterium]
MKRLIFFLILFSELTLSAQKDSVAYSRDYEFKEGIFIDGKSFRMNNPIPKNSIITAIPKNQLDLLDEVMEYKTVSYKDTSGKEMQLETATAWGYCQNRTIYLNFNKQFNRVNVIGSLCHLTAHVTTQVGYRDPMDYNYGINNSYDELRQFVYDTKTDKVYDFNVKTMELLLKEDPALYDQFMKLKRREKADSIFIYLRKYNEKHPLYLPI